MKKISAHLLILIFSLLAFGLLIIANSTTIYSNILYGDPYKFLILHIAWILVGLAGFYFFYKLNYQKIGHLAYILFLVAIGSLFLLGIMGLLPCKSDFAFAPCINGANRWLFLNPSPLPQLPFLGVIGFQPSEFAKLALILYLAVQLSKNILKKQDAFMVYAVVSGLMSGLILLQPNMSTAAMIFTIGTIMFFSSGASLKRLITLIPIVLGTGIVFMFSSSYRRSRLLTLIKGDEGFDLSSGYHIKQVLISLGSGGLLGIGFGQSRQKYQYLPEIASDSIFAIIGEEFGYVGTTLVILAFVYFLYLGFNIAKNAPDLLGRLLAVGVTSWIGLQFFVNTAAMTKLIPLTGVPIPLISYGGSSMVFSLMGLGILANISKHKI